MSQQHEIDRLNWNVAGLEVDSALARICVPPVKVVPRVSLVDRPWFIRVMYLAAAVAVSLSVWVSV